MDQWTREALVEVLTHFLDASFEFVSSCRAIFRETDRRGRDERRAAALRAHSAENEALTRLRILAPPGVVDNARTLIQSEYWLASHVSPSHLHPTTSTC